MKDSALLSYLVSKLVILFRFLRIAPLSRILFLEIYSHLAGQDIHIYLYALIVPCILVTIYQDVISSLCLYFQISLT
jgi:hypothetical protein